MEGSAATTFLTLSGTVFALSLVIIAVVKGRKRRFQNWRELKKLENQNYCSRIGEIVQLEEVKVWNAEPISSFRTNL